MLRRTNLIVGLLLVISAALVASSSTPSMAATASTIAATGKIVVTIRAPRGVPADVTLTGPRKTVFAKAAAGPSKSVSRKLPTGNYRVRPQPVISKGVLYQSPSHQIVTVAAGRTIRITVTFSRIRADDPDPGDVQQGPVRLRAARHRHLDSGPDRHRSWPEGRKAVQLCAVHPSRWPLGRPDHPAGRHVRCCGQQDRFLRRRAGHSAGHAGRGPDGDANGIRRASDAQLRCHDTRDRLRGRAAAVS